MKIGVITDIHNNLPALETALRFFEQEGCEEILCCGDIIGIGPYPEETVSRVRQLENFHAVCGNHDCYLTEGLRFPWPDGMEDGEAAHHYWEHGLLSAESKAYLHSLPRQLLLERENVRICLSHYPLTADGKFSPFVRRPSAGECDRLFAEMPQADVYLYGHDHLPSFQKGRALYLNFGSLGAPYRAGDIARCGVLTVEKGKTRWETVSLRYDLAAVIDRIRTLRYSDWEMISKIFFGA